MDECIRLSCLTIACPTSSCYGICYFTMNGPIRLGEYGFRNGIGDKHRRIQPKATMSCKKRHPLRISEKWVKEICLDSTFLRMKSGISVHSFQLDLVMRTTGWSWAFRLMLAMQILTISGAFSSPCHQQTKMGAFFRTSVVLGFGMFL